MDIQINTTQKTHCKYANTICNFIYEAAKKRGTGIARRNPEYIKEKIINGKAIIATQREKFVGFCYLEHWENKKYVVNSGLIVSEEYRNKGVGKKIKNAAFKLSRKKYPNSKILGLTTSLAVMKINSSLGYNPVTFSEFNCDDAFWINCKSCVNYDILMRTNKKHCLCTGMRYDPKNNNTILPFKNKIKAYKRLLKYKRSILLKNNFKSKKIKLTNKHV